MKRILSKKFFDRSVFDVAEDIIGKFLVIKNDEKEKAFMIIEVEVYDGVEDKASHASKGRTERTEVMFGSAGIFYIYLVYGMYNMLNIVTGKKDYPAAVLIRGVDGISGPGKLTKQLKITKIFNNKKAIRKNGLWFEDRGVKIAKNKIKKTTRIGVSYAGAIWAEKPYRFVLK